MRVPCEFFLIRYVPDVVRGEFANIGVVLRPVSAGLDAAARGNAASPGALGLVGMCRFTRDWSRVRCMDAGADLALLEGLEGEIGERLRLEAGTHPADAPQAPGRHFPGKDVIASLGDALSNSVQISDARACLAENMASEIELLMRMYVEPFKAAKVRVRTGRAAIVAAMRTEFERAGVWAMMRKRIAASGYTRVGDPMRLDCGYRAGPASGLTVRVLHGVSLDGDVEAAKGLAYSAAGLRAGVERVEGARLELTAVVEPLSAIAEASDEEGERWQRYRFGVEAMEERAIRVVTVNDLARVAAAARVELGL